MANTVEIKIDLNDGGAYERLKAMKSILDEFRGKRINIDFTGQFTSIQNSLKRLESSLDSVKGKSKTTISVEDKGLLEAVNKLQEVTEKIHEVSSKEAEVKVNADSADTAVTKLQQVASVLGDISSLASSVGTVFSGLGDFSGMFGSAFEGMAGLFKTDLMSIVSRTLTYMGTRSVVGEIGGILSRYDIMNTFVPYMELAGVDQYTAERALGRVDQSIRGIPIGLDEAAFRLRKYQMYLNDINRATDFTIGIQKAIMAGGASQQMQTTAYTQIDRLLATGKLGQSRQWLSLFNGLGVSLKFLREELALDPTADLKTIAADLANGTIATEDFIRAIERLSKNEGLDQALSIYKGTIEAWTSNIQNAIKRGGQGILESVNTVMEDTYGVGITGVMERVRDQIDVVAKDAKEYILNNPQNVSIIGDIAEGIFQRLGTVDFGGFVDKVFTNIGAIGDTLLATFDALPKGFLEDFTSFAVTWAGPMSMVFKAVNSGLPQMIGVFERVKGMDMGEVFGKITGQVELMAGAISKVLGLLNDDALGDIMAFGLVWGKPIANVLGAITQQLGALTLALQNPLVQKLGGIFKGIPNGFLSLLNYGTDALGVSMGGPGMLAGLGVAGIGAAAIIGGGTAYRKWWEKNYEEDVLGRTTAESARLQVESADAVLEMIRQNDEMRESNMAAIDADHRRAQQLVDDIHTLGGEIDSAVGEEKTTKIEELLGTMNELYKLSPGMDLSFDMETSKLTEEAEQLLGVADLVTDLDYQSRRADQIEADIDQKQQENKAVHEEWLDNARELRLAEDRLRELQDTYNRWEAETYPDMDSVEDITGDVRTGAVADDERTKQINSLEKQRETVENLQKKQSELNETYYSGTEDLKRLGEELVKSGYTIEEIQSKLDGANQEVLDYVENFQLMQERYNEIRESISGIIEQQTSGFSEYQAPENPFTMESSAAGVQSQIDAMTAYRDNLAVLGEYVDSLDEESQEIYEAGLQALAEGGLEYSGLLNELVSQVMGASDSEGVKTALDTWFANNDLKGTLQEQIKDLWADILMTTEYDDEEYQNTEMFKGFGEFLSQGIMSQLEALSGEDGVFAPGGVAEQKTQEIIDTVIEPWNSAFDGENGLATSMQSTFDMLKTQIESIAEIDLSGYTGSLEEVSGAQDEVASSAEEASSQISSLADTASSKAGAFSGLISSIGEVASAASTASSEVSSLVMAIAALQDKTVTVRVNVAQSGVVGSVMGMASAIGNAEGGYAGTGRLLLGPTGTDTIPTYLSPGEFVIKERSARMLGSTFLYKINNMDIGGAFDSIMSRVANPMSGVVNNYYDNHAAVHQHFHGETGQGYSQRRAYKWVSRV